MKAAISFGIDSDYFGALLKLFHPNGMIDELLGS
jgi:hypothetical protein